jgi:hypothetical protein
MAFAGPFAYNNREDSPGEVERRGAMYAVREPMGDDGRQAGVSREMRSWIDEEEKIAV